MNTGEGKTMVQEDKPGRLMSLDTLRGFDMWFITGGSAMIVAICQVCGWGDHCWLAEQMRHVPWEGLVHHDTIFPLFLFLAGVSWPFSLAAQQAKDRTMGQIHRKIFLRAVILYLLGASGSLLTFKSDWRVMGVLNFIGPCWGLAALLFLHVKKPWVRASIVAALLLGYWAVLASFLAPDAPAGATTFSKLGNIVSWLDRTIWPTHLLAKGVYEPESVFSITGGVALAMLGMGAGALLKSDRFRPARKAGLLALGAVGSFLLGLFFTYVLGDVCVKALWTSSFVLFAAAYSAAMLALFYWIVDVRGWRGWTLYFRVIGLNSITIYMAMRIVGFEKTNKYFFGGLANLFPAPWSTFVIDLGMLVVVWTFLYFLYRRKIFLKV